MSQPLEFIGGFINVLSHQMEQHLLKELESRGYNDIRIAHFVVFRDLAPDGSRLTELASRAGMTKQSMSELVEYLKQHGYLSQVADERDRRARKLILSSKGQQLNQAILEIAEEFESGLRRKIGSQEFRHLRTLLAKLVEPASSHVAKG